MRLIDFAIPYKMKISLDEFLEGEDETEEEVKDIMDNIIENEKNVFMADKHQ